MFLALPNSESCFTGCVGGVIPRYGWLLRIVSE
jgi:hypothetical protein